MRVLQEKPVLRVNWEACTNHDRVPAPDSLHNFCRNVSEQQRQPLEQPGCEICVPKLLGNRARKLNLALVVQFRTGPRLLHRAPSTGWRKYVTSTSLQQIVALSTLKLIGMHAEPAVQGAVLQFQLCS
jgi:hypothetical protein